MRFLSTLAASVIGTLIAFGLVVFFLVFFVFALSLSADQTPTVQPGSVLTVPLQGDVPERVTPDPFRQAFGEGAYDLRDLQTALRKASTDSRIDAVWLRMKGLSAGWATLEEVRQAVLEARRSGVPVIASSDEFGMTEKGYFVASAADSVFTAPQSSFEYNGFATILAFFDGAFERLNVEPQIIRAGKYKSAGEPFVRKDLSDPNREQLTALLETVNDRFMTTIAEARGQSVETLNRLADEEAFLSSSTAVEEGLIDRLLYEDEVRDRLRAITGSGGVTENISTVSVEKYRRIPAESAGQTYTGTGQIDIVYARGNIVTGEPGESPARPGPEMLGSTTLTEALETARTSASTEAVVLRVNSPGGSAAASEAMWRAVNRTAAEKPVVVSMGDVAASGGYYLAAAADSIVADPTTTTGSIGVFGLLVNAQGFFQDKLGVTFDGVRTSPYADLFSPTKPLTDRERRLIGTSIDQTYQTFLQRVADGRGMSVAAVDSVAQGRVWSGRDAKEIGLVDTTGTLADAVAMAGQAAGLGEGPYRTRLLPRPKTFVERLSEQFAAQARQLWTSTTMSAMEETFWQKKRMLDRVLGAQGAIQTRLPFTPTIE